VTSYGPVLHGEAVGYGMAVAVRVAAARGVLEPEVATRITGLLLAAGLPVTPKTVPASFAADDVIAALAKIRQVRDGSLRFVLPAAVGTSLVADEVSDDEIRTALNVGPCR
jgi:3-dehydroquinate synthase